MPHEEKRPLHAAVRQCTAQPLHEHPTRMLFACFFSDHVAWVWAGHWFVHGGEGVRTDPGAGATPSQGSGAFQLSRAAKLLDDLHCLNLQTFEWKRLRHALAPSPRKCHTAALVHLEPPSDRAPGQGGPHVLIFGGVQQGSSSPTAELSAMNLAHVHSKSTSWKRLLPSGVPPVARHSHTATAIPAQDIAQVGASTGLFNAAALKHTPASLPPLMLLFGGFSVATAVHTNQAALERVGAGAVAAMRRACKGAPSGGAVLGDVVVFDAVANAWHHITSRITGEHPAPRGGHSASFLPGRDRRRPPSVLIVGGSSWRREAGGGETWTQVYLHDLALLDLEGLTWTNVQVGFLTLPPRHRHSTVLVSSSQKASTLHTRPGDATRLLPQMQLQRAAAPKTRLHVLVFGGMNDKFLPSVTWRGRVRRRRGHFYTTTQTVPRSALRALTYSQHGDMLATPAGRLVPVPRSPDKHLTGDLRALVYASDDEDDSDGVGEDEARRLVERARQVGQRALDASTLRSPSGHSSRVLLTADVDTMQYGKLQSPVGVLDDTIPLPPSSAFADIVAEAGQSMAEAVQLRLLQLQKETISLHRQVDAERATRRHAQAQADALRASLTEQKQQLALATRVAEERLRAQKDEADAQVRAAQAAAQQAQAELKRVVLAAQLFQSAAESRLLAAEVGDSAGLLHLRDVLPAHYGTRNAAVQTDEPMKEDLFAGVDGVQSVASPSCDTGSPAASTGAPPDSPGSLQQDSLPQPGAMRRGSRRMVRQASLTSMPIGDAGLPPASVRTQLQTRTAAPPPPSLARPGANGKVKAERQAAQDLTAE